ncbi:ABC transporter permease [Actinomadura livida]|uniref:ABC transporter permease n=1 Tax=Actinomadura livida TaxID=79909 RepID=A0A7W7MYK8_9ACTN|nr:MULTISPECIES: ABC transporter permease [Actinomadura]MBB4775883.1 ABC-2 type transport system permease protein [Actinomadura catellatispora]GGU39353.1 ABC transporter permease [Actinomadura livida]
MNAALKTETAKFLRSRAPWATAAAFLLPVALAAIFVGASGTPPLDEKSQALGITPDWPGFHSALMQIDAAGGFLLFGILVTWMFGREYSDRTVLDLLALPTSRTSIVLAKFTVTTAWLILLAALQTAAWVATGIMLGLPGTPHRGLAELLMLLALTGALALPIALAASAGRGYLPGIAATVALLVCGVAAAILGAAAWFPWALPATVGGLSGAASRPLTAPAIAAATAAAGIAATTLWWRRADH